MIWIIIFVIIIFLAYQGDETRSYPKRKLVFYRLLLAVVLSLISAVGSPTGSDHEWYAAVYNDINKLSFSNFSTYEHYEPGYIIFNGICRLFGIPEATFFLIISLFINSIIVDFVFRYKYPVINIALFFIGGSLIMQGNIVRQEIAAAIIVYSMRFFPQEQIGKYIICIAIAGMFHYTALFFLILIPLFYNKTKAKEKLAKYVMIGLLLISILISLGYMTLPMQDLISMATYYENYIHSEDGVGLKISIYRILFYNVIAFLFILFSNKKYYYLVSVLVLYAINLNLTTVVPNLARMGTYFGLISVTLILHSIGGGVINKFKLEKHASIIHFSLIVIIMAVFISNFVLSDNVILCSKTYSISDFF